MRNIIQYLLLLFLGLVVLVLSGCSGGGGGGVAPNPVPLPDTGQTVNYTGALDDGEDSDYGINFLSYTDNGNDTVTDDVTGLVWQQQDDNLTYNWYQASGTFEATDNPTTNDVCGTLDLGGQTDWRLPTKKELVSILNLGTFDPAIDGLFFPSTNSSVYWTTTSYNIDPALAWSVDFEEGGAFFWNKTPVGAADDVYVRCVRGQGSSGPLTDNGDSTVTDIKTGLMWQQTEGGALDWYSALTACEDETLAGYTDWRLPNFKELESLTDDGRFNPVVSTVYFPNVDVVSPYWSSSSEDFQPLNAWLVSFFNGLGDFFNKVNAYNVRCVR